jgi:hypothetical protein
MNAKLNLKRRMQMAQVVVHVFWKRSSGLGKGHDARIRETPKNKQSCSSESMTFPSPTNSAELRRPGHRDDFLDDREDKLVELNTQGSRKMMKREDTAGKSLYNKISETAPIS